MKVFHISTFEGGGAGRAAYRLHHGLREAACDSHMLVNQKVSRDPFVHELKIPSPESRPQPSIPVRVLKKLRNRLLPPDSPREKPKSVTFSSPLETNLKSSDLAQVSTAQIVNLHWIARFLDFSSCIPWLATQAPLVWTLHDLYPLRGIWHYEPTVDDTIPELRELELESIRKKEQALEGIRDDQLRVVAPSRWMAEMSKQSQLLRRFDVTVIPYGIDIDFYKPIEKSLAKLAFGIESRRFVVGYAGGQREHRKGFFVLKEALKAARIPNLLLLSVGPGAPFEEDQELHLGLLEHDALMRLFYSAVDLFICPSMQDNFPNTVLEANACGTPVIGSDAGGIPEMIREDETGWIFPRGQPQDLRECLEHSANARNRLVEMGLQARAHCVKNYSEKRQADVYMTLYQDHLNTQV